jgi:hypothetical protein
MMDGLLSQKFRLGFSVSYILLYNRVLFLHIITDGNPALLLLLLLLSVLPPLLLLLLLLLFAVAAVVAVAFVKLIT